RRDEEAALLVPDGVEIGGADRPDDVDIPILPAVDTGGLIVLGDEDQLVRVRRGLPVVVVANEGQAIVARLAEAPRSGTDRRIRRPVKAGDRALTDRP